MLHSTRIIHSRQCCNLYLLPWHSAVCPTMSDGELISWRFAWQTATIRAGQQDSINRHENSTYDSPTHRNIWKWNEFVEVYLCSQHSGGIKTSARRECPQTGGRASRGKLSDGKISRGKCSTFCIQPLSVSFLRILTAMLLTYFIGAYYSLRWKTVLQIFHMHLCSNIAHKLQ